MATPTTSGQIVALLIPTIIVAVSNSYIPHEFTMIRQLLSLILLGLMALIMILAIKSVLKEF